MFRLDTKTKNYVFNNIIKGCKNYRLDYVTSLDHDGNIKGIKINNNIIYNINDIGVMGVSLLAKEDHNGFSSLWDIRKLFEFIINNNK